jgi:DNA repair protein RadC
MYRIEFQLKTFTVREASSDLEICSRHMRPLFKDAKAVWEVAAAVYQEMDPDREHFVVFFVNTKNVMLGYKHLSTGSLSASFIHPAEVMTAIFRFAVDEQRPHGIILTHNHPSGDPNPSVEDRDITEKLKSCALMHGIQLVDHVILGDLKYCSFRDSGLLND